MQLRIKNHSYVIDFMDEGFESDNLNALVKSEVECFIKIINDEKLEGWELRFSFIYNTARDILISRKGRFYPVEKYKEVIIHIPIPLFEQVAWGVRKDQWIYELDHFDKIIQNFDCLPVNYSQFNNRADYILDSMRRSIAFCLNKGVTVNGVKIKR